MGHISLRLRVAVLLVSCLGICAPGCGGSNEGTAQSVALLAGLAGGPGFFDGADNTTIRFASPSGVALIGTDLFVADNTNHVIRKVDTVTNTVTTLAGAFGVADNTNGTGAAARFNSPGGITAVGTILFVTDTGNHTIRRIVSTSGEVTTLAGSAGSPGSTDNTIGANARFNRPRGIASDGASTLYVADTGNHTIRAVTLAGATTTFAGSGTSGSADGLGAAAQFSSPEGVTVLAGAPGTLFVADTGNHTIRQVLAQGVQGNVATLAGLAGNPGATDNVGANARFSSPSGITNDGVTIFVADTGNHTIRSVTQAPGVVTTLAGLAGSPGSTDNTIGANARFNGPRGVGMLANASVLFVADTGNHAIRQVTLSGDVTTRAGKPPQPGTTDGTGTAARFRSPAGAAVVSDNVFVADSGNHTIRNVSSTGVVTTLAGLAQIPGLADGTGSGARFNSPQGVAAVGSDLYVADSGNHAIRKVTAAGSVTTFAGSTTGTAGFVDATGTAARFNNPKGIAATGTFLFVADTGNHAIRKINIGTGAVTTLAGTGAAGFADTPTPTFNLPEGIAVIGQNLFVADTGNHAVRRINNFNAAFPPVTTIAGAPPPTAVSGFADGSGTAARFSSPRGIAAVGSVLFLADTGNHAVRRITTAGTVTTFVGDPAAATTRDGDASQALLNAPAGITGIDGTLFFTDVNENVVRKILF